MPQSFARIILHSTFSTKYRLPLIDPSIEAELHAVIRSAMQNMGATVLRIGGVPDHVHIVHSLPRTVAIAELMRAAKSVSSSWIKTQGVQYRRFNWQDGYATFSVDYRKVDLLIRYVDRQKEHHGLAGSGLSYEAEFEKLLQNFGFTAYNRAYLFPEPPEDDLLSEPLPAYGLSQPWKGVSLSDGSEISPQVKFRPIARWDRKRTALIQSKT